MREERRCILGGGCGKQRLVRLSARHLLVSDVLGRSVGISHEVI